MPTFIQRQQKTKDNGGKIKCNKNLFHSDYVNVMILKLQTTLIEGSTQKDFSNAG